MVLRLVDTRVGGRRASYVCEIKLADRKVTLASVRYFGLLPITWTASQSSPAKGAEQRADDADAAMQKIVDQIRTKLPVKPDVVAEQAGALA